MNLHELRALAETIQGHIQAQRWGQALDGLEQYCEAKPADYRAHYMRAFVQSKRGKTALAREALDHALKLNPGYEKALALLKEIEDFDRFGISDSLVAPAPTGGLGAVLPTPTNLSATPPPAPGQMVGNRYRLVRLLGAGGMGQVWQAHDTTLHDRPVALKRVHRDLVATPEMLKRFQREVTALADLAHPNIVNVTDSGTDASGPYYVMEFLAGRTLKDWIEQRRQTGPPPVADALDLFRPVLRAVGFAHSKGVVHRDLKPENVFLTEHGGVKVLDFGLARASADIGVTQAGQRLGTPAYMSPEQFRGAPADARSDIYALGVILFEILTLRRPFEGESWINLSVQHQRTDPPSPRTFRRDLPEPIEVAVLRALEKDPDARYRSADEFCQSLEAAVAPAAASRLAVNETALRTLAQSAWSDGKLSAQEKEAFFEAAKAMGATREQAGKALEAARPDRRHLQVLPSPPSSQPAPTRLTQPPSGRYCTACGALISHDAVYCTECGKSVGRVETPPVSPPKIPAPGAKASLVWAVAGYVCCIGIVAWPVGLWQGGKARRLIRENPSVYEGDSMALTGMILAWVGLALAALGMLGAIMDSL